MFDVASKLNYKADDLKYIINNEDKMILERVIPEAINRQSICGASVEFSNNNTELVSEDLSIKLL